MNGMFANAGNFLNYVTIHNNTVLNFIKYGFDKNYPKDKLIRLQMIVDDFIMPPEEFVEGLNKLLGKKYDIESLHENMEEIYLLMKDKGEYPTIDEIANFNLLFSSINVN